MVQRTCLFCDHWGKIPKMPGIRFRCELTNDRTLYSHACEEWSGEENTPEPSEIVTVQQTLSMIAEVGL